MELDALIKDLAYILAVAGVVTLLFKKLKQPLVLGYIVAGFLVSPHMPYTMSVMDSKNIHTWADIGILFLLFSLGLDFSFKKIIKKGISPVISACTIIFCMMMIGIIAGHQFGWSRMNSIFLGGMLAMSSTTIIYKALDDLGLRQQHFASLVMSVLILEDVLAIVMMVMLSAIAEGNANSDALLGSVIKIVFFIILWFVVGIFAIPLFLRSVRKLLNSETLLILSLGLCCMMAVFSTMVGFSSAFGAFVMGSILAETIEADKIIRLVEPVKNLFGAIFFVSVGMLVDPAVLVDYALPIIVLVLCIIIGQMTFGSMGFMLSGQTLRTSMKCGFSMTQIGDFSFIIASLGLSLGVISDFLYPVIVAVSVITTFFTPYIIRMADPCYNALEKHLPEKWIQRINRLTVNSRSVNGEVSPSQSAAGHWKPLLRQMGLNTLIYSTLCVAVISVMLVLFKPFINHILPKPWGSIVCALTTILLLSPFLRSIVAKKNHNEHFKALWAENSLNRLPLMFTILVRVVIASGFVFYVCHHIFAFNKALLISIAFITIVLIFLSRRLKKQSISLERMFVKNLNSREIQAQVLGKKRPLYEGRLLDRDIHISDIEVPDDSVWAGKTLKSLQIAKRFGVHVSSILRGRQRINIPGGNTIIFPGDRLDVIGTDEQLSAFNQAINNEVQEEDPDLEAREMKLRQIVIRSGSPLKDKTLRESGLRDEYGCMLIGMEEGREHLTPTSPSRKFEEGDILWVVGEESSLQKLTQS